MSLEMRKIEAENRLKPGPEIKVDFFCRLASHTLKSKVEPWGSMLEQAFDFPREMLHGNTTMTCEEDRTRLIGEIARVLRETSVPDETRAAALTLIGWLARRMPGEGASQAGVAEMCGRSASASRR